MFSALIYLRCILAAPTIYICLESAILHLGLWEGRIVWWMVHPAAFSWPSCVLHWVCFIYKSGKLFKKHRSTFEGGKLQF